MTRRSLFLVAQLTKRWGSRYSHCGKTIWAEQTIPGHAPVPADIQQASA
ncbi:hypothetical protein OHA79_09885 [Streptomyces sp. NBC_00841]|nr:MULTISPECIES: hypothetical protein [unclassified Streptomyces]MCX4536665.1 hypothetical protein [Streptomyces sp. NBC_01669]WRZ98114.1 hypothetical protein OHA79_09885 [Streptomyces sp. NBC_00841]